jgi:hypothetical protein
MADQFSDSDSEQEERDAKLDAFSGHEVLHVASIASDFFDRHLLEHRFVKAHPELGAAAERISDALGEFYQLCGRVTLGDGCSREADSGNA